MQPPHTMRNGPGTQVPIGAASSVDRPTTSDRGLVPLYGTFGGLRRGRATAPRQLGVQKLESDRASVGAKRYLRREADA